ncbi:MAG: hypothetical protein OEL66_00710 [Desulfobulbaceae bacterium]|nr:hypothetical protein [Desulfobulbaceae bacterium]
MKSTTGLKLKFFPTIFCAIAFLFAMSGCAEMNLGGPSADVTPTPAATSSDEPAISENQPYYPTDFNDLLIPGELTWNRDKSMSIRTASFAGGILHFSGRVEINSLTDFFLTSMTKDGWKMTGSVKQKSNLLVFSKKNKASMITISEGEFSLNKTEVYVYITEDIAAENNEHTTSEESFN